MKSSHFNTPDHQETLSLSFFGKKIFFYQNHELAPLENCDFWPYENFPF